MFEQAFKNIDDVLRKEAGCTTELDYTEQTSWLLFLKYLDALEQDRATEAKLEGRRYAYLLPAEFRWDSWAAPKTKSGQIDHNRAQTGPDLVDFVNARLFPFLQDFRTKASGPDTIEYKIGQIFGELKNRIQSGYNLREIIDHVDELRFRSQQEKHELSHLYEAKIKNMGNAGRNGGEYYTPRPLIRAMIQVVRPQIGETIYDGACGSAGFLCEAFVYLKHERKDKLTTKEAKILQERTFYGKEKKSLAYVIAIMNLILHGVETPNIVHTNTLTENVNDIQAKDQVDVILANPPFGGKERKEIQQNFNIKTGETAFLFLQHVVPVAASKMLPLFLAYSIGAGVSQQWLGGVKKGAAYVGINIEDLRRLPVHAPNIDKQRAIVGRLELISTDTQRLAALYQQKLTALDELKKSLLARAFAGELTSAEADAVA
jgi:type I restriction enzyme M protein